MFAGKTGAGELLFVNARHGARLWQLERSCGLFYMHVGKKQVRRKENAKSSCVMMGTVCSLHGEGNHETYHARGRIEEKGRSKLCGLEKKKERKASSFGAIVGGKACGPA